MGDSWQVLCHAQQRCVSGDAHVLMLIPSQVALFAEQFKEILETRFGRGLLRCLYILEKQVGQGQGILRSTFSEKQRLRLSIPCQGNTHRAANCSIRIPLKICSQHRISHTYFCHQLMLFSICRPSRPRPRRRRSERHERRRSERSGRPPRRRRPPKRRRPRRRMPRRRMLIRRMATRRTGSAPAAMLRHPWRRTPSLRRMLW